MGRRRGILLIVLLVFFSAPSGLWADASAPQGGSIANHTGRAFEHTIQRTLEARGFRTISHGAWLKSATKEPPDRLLLTNVPYFNIYGRRGRSEFVLVSRSPDLRIRIEAKWSQGPGSHDEKFAYLYLNAVEAMPENRVIIVTGGGVWRKGSVEWLKNAAHMKRYTNEKTRQKRVEVMNIRQFKAWTEATFK